MIHDLRMCRTILVPLDGSSLAEQAIPLASGIALRAGASLCLALVHRGAAPDLAAGPAGPVEQAVRRTERSYLRAVEARLRDRGVPVASAVTLTGAVAPALARYAADVEADLVVMASHGRGGLSRAWLGSVAEALIRRLEVPVLLARPEARGTAAGSGGARRVLVPLDGSTTAESALGAAARYARLWDADLRLVQVVPPVLVAVDPMLPLPTAYDEELTSRCRAWAERYLDGVVGRLRAEGYRATAAVTVAPNPGEALLELARLEHAELIVLATHGHGGLRRLVLGSVSDKVIRGAELPVLVVRPTGRPAQLRRIARAAATSG